MIFKTFVNTSRFRPAHRATIAGHFVSNGVCKSIARNASSIRSALLTLSALVILGAILSPQAMAQPTALNDVSIATEGTLVAVPILEDDIPGGEPIDPYSVVIVYPPEHGELSVDYLTGNVYYLADVGYSGPDDFAYAVADTSGEWSNIATSSLLVGENLAPRIIEFDCVYLGSDLWKFIGVIEDESPQSCTFEITTTEFDGPTAASHIVVDGNGNFSVTVSLAEPPDSPVAIRAFDDIGQESNVAQLFTE